MPEIPFALQFVLGVIAAIAGIVTALVGNELGPNITYWLTRRGRVPNPHPQRLWIIFYVSALTSVVLGTVIALAPTPSDSIAQAFPSTPTPSISSTPRDISVPSATPRVLTATPMPSTRTATPTATLLPPTDTPKPAPRPGDRQTRSSDGMEIVYVPGGMFQMGNSDEQVDHAMPLCDEYRDDCQRRWFEDEQPVHSVTLDSFWIDRTEVTNAQYARCVDAGVCQAPTTCDFGEPTYNDASKANHPAVCVDWTGAQAYCEWAGGRLPTEAEWEYAARGPEGFVFPWGEAFDGTRLNFCDVNCTYDWKTTDYDDGYEETAPVDSFENGASWCGALDLAGNAWEWVQDWYDVYPEGPQTNSTGPDTGDRRVVRGGSWGDLANFTRSAYRDGINPGDRRRDFGFRCVVDFTSSP